MSRPLLAASTPGRLARWLAAALLLIAIAGAYWPVARAGFVWDDDANVTENLPLRSARGLRALWLEPGVTTQYYPLVYTSFWLEHHAWGLRPLGYHVDNVLLHAAASLLLWRLLLLLGLPGAWLAAAIFALHPLQVETVAWVTERKNLLAFVFQLLAALAWFAWVSDAAGAPRREWGARRIAGYALALVLALAALLAKVTSVSLGPTLLLLSWWKRGRLRIADVLPVLPMIAFSIPIGLLARSLESGLGETLGFEWSPTPLERLLQAASALCFYLWKLVWPVDLAFNYPRWEIDAGDPLHYLPLALVLALVASSIAARRRLGRGPLLALLYFAGTLAPVLGLLEVYYFRFSYVADHWQYSACIGPIALFAAAATRWLDARELRVQRAAPVCAAVLVVSLALLTLQQSRSFESAEILWRDSLEQHPDSLLARFNLGATLQQQGRLHEALEQYRLAQAIDPRAAMVHVNIGVIQAGMGHLDEAIASYQRALALDPDRKRLQWNLGLALERKGRFEDALPYLERALVDPEPTPREQLRLTHSHAELGDLLLRHGRAQRAVGHYQRALGLDPEYRVAQLGLAEAWLQLGQPGRAIPQLEAALRARPQDAETRRKLERARRSAAANGPQSSSMIAPSACITRWCTASTGRSPAIRIT